LFEFAILFSSDIPKDVQNCVYANLGCYYQMRKETDASKLYFHQAASHKEDLRSKLLESKILTAISLNNLTVLKLKEGEDLRTALKIAKNALNLIESDIL